MKFHSFIIGGGIAGSVMALTLAEHGYRVKIFERPSQNISSRVAAGLFNPITGKRQTVSWRALDFFDEADTFYSRFEKLLDVTFFHLLPTSRILSSATDQNNWALRINVPEIRPFLGNPTFVKLKDSVFNNPFQCLNVNRGGWLDIILFLNNTRDFFKKREAHATREFTMSDVEQNGTGYGYGEDTAENLFFCQGVDGDPIWKELPLIPVKGEILTILCPEAQNQAIVLSGCFMLPIGNHLFRIGSTYDWKHTDTKPTPEGRGELEKKLKAFLKVPYSVVKHEAGIRPTTRDRRPILGEHMNYQNAYIFNGLGSKGVSAAPLLAKWLFNFAVHGSPLPKEVSPLRFK